MTTISTQALYKPYFNLQTTSQFPQHFHSFGYTSLVNNGKSYKIELNHFFYKRRPTGNGPVPSEYVEAFDHVTSKVKQNGRLSEGTEIEFLFTEDVDDESLLMSLDMIECFSSSDEFEEVENELDAVWNDVSF